LADGIVFVLYRGSNLKQAARLVVIAISKEYRIHHRIFTLVCHHLRGKYVGELDVLCKVTGYHAHAKSALEATYTYPSVNERVCGCAMVIGDVYPEALIRGFCYAAFKHLIRSVCRSFADIRIKLWIVSHHLTNLLFEVGGYRSYLLLGGPSAGD